MNYVSQSLTDYPDFRRHWSASSEPYAGGDALLTKLNQGWATAETVRSQLHWLTSARSVVVYHFELHRGDEKLTMPVIANPFVDRFIREQVLMVKAADAIAPHIAQPAQAQTAQAQPAPAPIAIRRRPLPTSRIAAKAAAYAYAARM
jgi:hypothetical protein